MKGDIVKFSAVENNIIEVRGEKVILDSVVASLYGVETRVINQAVKNNPNKFPDGYILELTNKEKANVIKIFDHLNVKYSHARPKAFTEKGLYMLATILKSEKATETTIAIVETFAKIRELSRTVAELSNSPDEYAQKSLMQRSGDIIADILGDDMQTTDTETSIELNFAVLKFKHTITKKKNDK